MTNKEFLNQLALKLMGSDARIKELEQQVSSLTMKLAKAKSELVATSIEEKKN